MPRSIRRPETVALSPRFDEALTLVRNEFLSLDPDQQYRNAFARVLKSDPLDRVTMLGTDQRDLFVPVLGDLAAGVLAPGGSVLDVGGGDGQTFALFADRVPCDVTISLVEPNAGYVADYESYLATQRHLRPGIMMVAGFDDIDAVHPPPPPNGSVDLVLALHMLYFVRDPVAAIVRMARFLSRGGAVCMVIAEETRAFTGQVLQAYLSAGGTIADSEPLVAIAQRESLLSGAISGVLAEHLPESVFTQTTHLQPSRLYGHSIADLIALGSIGELAGVDDGRKFDASTNLLREMPEAVDLRLEDDGPRKGMWSVSQPQRVTILRREG